MLKYLQLPFQFDAARMLQEVSQLEDSRWKLHYQQLHYEGEWSAIPLRSTGGNADNIYIAATNNIPYHDTPFLDHSPYLKEILREFKCPLLSVRLLKLDAGALIKEHRDADLCFEKGEVRIHIPVITHEEVEFYLDKERIRMKAGECWYLNFNLPHSIHNKSDINRIHLVIDATVNDWVNQLFGMPADNKKEIPDTGFDTDTKIRIIAQLRSMNTETATRLADEMEGTLQK